MCLKSTGSVPFFTCCQTGIQLTHMKPGSAEKKGYDHVELEPHERVVAEEEEKSIERRMSIESDWHTRIPLSLLKGDLASGLNGHEAYYGLFEVSGWTQS